MSTVPLPDAPSLEQLRNQARELQRAVNAGSEDAQLMISELLPGPAVAAPDLPLHLAQLALARRYGFPSWRRLKEHVQVLQHYSRRPGQPSSAEPLEQFLANAVLTYGDLDGPDRWQTARDVLSAEPDLTRISIHAAAAAADHQAIADLLAGDSRLAQQQGGPLRWEPLLYLCYSRLDPHVPVADVITSAGLLLQHGADPNAGYLWYGQPTPFTALTGVFGEGEQGPGRQPAHPHQRLLARLLLEGGADPNDAQTLYNRMFQPANDHLELLFDYGLGAGDGGPWHSRLPESTDSPRDLLRAQLGWAVTHGMTERIALLAEHGVDLESPLDSGTLPMVTSRTPLQVAMLAGQRESVALLRSLGVNGDPDPAIALVGALLEADVALVTELAVGNPGLLEQVRADHPALILRAAVADRPDSVQLLFANGFDVNAMGRQDIVVDQQWETALHHAAGAGKLEMAGLLLDLGADPAIRDRRFQGTARDWAVHLGHPHVVEMFDSTLSAPSPEDEESVE